MIKTKAISPRKAEDFRRGDVVRITKEGGINSRSPELLDASDHVGILLNGASVGYIWEYDGGADCYVTFRNFANKPEEDKEFTVCLAISAMEVTCRFEIGDMVRVKSEFTDREECADYSIYSYTPGDYPEAIIKAELDGDVIDVGGKVEVGFSCKRDVSTSTGVGKTIPLYAHLPGFFLERCEWEDPYVDPDRERANSDFDGFMAEASADEESSAEESPIGTLKQA